MKVTAIIPDQLIATVREYSKGKTITESLIIVLSEWVKLQEIHKLNTKLSLKPLQFDPDFSRQIRARSRRTRSEL